MTSHECWLFKKIGTQFIHSQPDVGLYRNLASFCVEQTIWPVSLWNPILGTSFDDALPDHKKCLAWRQYESRVLISKPLQYSVQQIYKKKNYTMLYKHIVTGTWLVGLPCALLYCRWDAAIVHIQCSARRHIVMCRDTCLPHMRTARYSRLVKYKTWVNKDRQLEIRKYKR